MDRIDPLAPWTPSIKVDNNVLQPRVAQPAAMQQKQVQTFTRKFAVTAWQPDLSPASAGSYNFNGGSFISNVLTGANNTLFSLPLDFLPLGSIVNHATLMYNIQPASSGTLLTIQFISQIDGTNTTAVNNPSHGALTFDGAWHTVDFNFSVISEPNRMIRSDYTSFLGLGFIGATNVGDVMLAAATVTFTAPGLHY